MIKDEVVIHSVNAERYMHRFQDTVVIVSVSQ